MIQSVSVAQKIRIWWDSARWVALPNSGMPCILGGLIAFSDGSFNLVRFVIAFFGVMAVHLGTNLLDDYADLKIGGFSLRDKVQKIEDKGVRTIKAPYVVDGTIRLNHVLYFSLALFAVGIAAGVYLTIASGWPVAVIAILGAIICFFYSMPPLSLCYHGMGEMVVGLAMGPGICLGTYYAVAQSFSWTPVLIGITIGCLVGLVLYVHSIMDFKPDLAAKKKTVVAYIGDRQKAIKLLPVILAVAYGTVILGILLRVLPPATLLVFLSLPMAIKLIQLMNRLGKGDYGETKLTWWMGPMEQMIEGLEWFLIRWRLARNLMMTITLLIFIAYAVELAF